MHNPEHVFDDRTPGVEEREPTASYLTGATIRIDGGIGAA